MLFCRTLYRYVVLFYSMSLCCFVVQYASMLFCCTVCRYGGLFFFYSMSLCLFVVQYAGMLFCCTVCRYVDFFTVCRYAVSDSVCGSGGMYPRGGVQIIGNITDLSHLLFYIIFRYWSEYKFDFFLITFLTEGCNITVRIIGYDKIDSVNFDNFGIEEMFFIFSLISI